MTAKVLTLLNLDRLREQQSSPPIFINDLPLETDADRQFLKDLAINKYETSDVVSVVPRCRCKTLAGAHRLGLICGFCGTKVTQAHSGKVESDLWIQAPAQLGVLPCPILWIYCDGPLSSKGFKGLEWICNPTYPFPDAKAKKPNKIIDTFFGLGIPRGLKSFINNIDLIIEKVVLPNITKMDKRAELLEFVRVFRSDIFCGAIPVPSRIAMVVESVSVGNYYDTTIDAAMEACFIAAGTAQEVSLTKIETRFTLVMSEMSKFCRESVKNILLKKKGFLRRVCYGIRNMYSFRGVITSLHEPHDYNTVRVPYHQLLTCYITEVVGRLIRKHGFTYRDAVSYVYAHQKDCDPLLWGMLEDFIDETPALQYVPLQGPKLPCSLKTKSHRRGRGIGTMGTRFPSLDRGSTQQLYITGISRDTIEISVIILRAYNADFDGDQLSFTIIKDNNLLEDGGAERFSPHYNIHDVDDPFRIRYIVDLPDVTVSNMSNRIESEEWVI